MARADYVVFDAGSSSLSCERCGAQEKVTVPVRLDVFVFQMKSYARLHGRCRVRTPVGGL